MPASAAQHKPPKAQPYGFPWPDHAWEWQILDPEADEILLELLAHDSSDTYAGWEERDWIRERKRNPVPWLGFLDDKRREKAERAAEKDQRNREQRAEDEARHAASMAEYNRAKAARLRDLEEQHRQELANHEARAAAQRAILEQMHAEQRIHHAEQRIHDEAERTKYHAARRAEWIDKLRAVGEHFAAVPRYRHMIPWVEHDIALIRDYPPGPIPWRFHQPTFDATWAERMKEADDAAHH